jgi:hypothetical protein
MSGCSVACSIGGKGKGGAVRWGKEKEWQADLLQIEVKD